MLSGGADSAYLLAQALRETKDVVTAHHVRMTGREASACEAIVAFCREHYRAFDYTESTVIHAESRLEMDIITVALEAGVAAVNFAAATGRMPRYWATGDCYEDRQKPHHTRIRRQHVQAVISASCYPHQAPEYLSLPVKTRAQIVRYLGEELASLCRPHEHVT